MYLNCPQRLGIAAGREFIAVSAPNPDLWLGLNKVIKVEVNKQKPKGACPAETEADSEPQPKITTSRPACSNTFVVGSFSRRPCFLIIVLFSLQFDLRLSGLKGSKFQPQFQ